MSDPKTLPHLLRLLDDPTPVVREQVRRKLAAFGNRLEDALLEIAPPPTEAQRHLIACLVDEHRREHLLEAFGEWANRNPSYENLEQGFRLIAEFQNGNGADLTARLDSLADEYESTFTRIAPRTLAHHLFSEERLTGNQDDFFNPANSNLLRVLETGKGIPISLCAVYILVGWRLGLEIEGCNFPGHFLARIHTEDGVAFVDCYHGGRFLTPSDLAESNPGAVEIVHRILQTQTPPTVILRRVANNLVRAYTEAGRSADAEFMGRVARRLRRGEQENATAEQSAALNLTRLARKAPRFATGALVRHRKYGYRGVVVDYDLSCKASNRWYRSNATQPDRDQPWYYVLVDGSDQTTYAAQTSLAPDESGEMIRHPLVPRFFSGIRKGSYLRNNRRWPRED